MSKEYLEALEHVYYGSQGYGETDKYYKYLKDYLESIDNAKPSEALECLEDIYRNGVFISDYDVFGKQHPTNISPETNKSISVQCDTIKQALLKTEKQEAKFLDNLQRWFLLLGESGANTKYKVRDEMEAVIDELKEVLE